MDDRQVCRKPSRPLTGRSIETKGRASASLARRGGRWAWGLRYFRRLLLWWVLEKLKRLGRFHVYECVCREFLGGI